jgi:septal ring factor EnvC (AmiA/AmiB activator)
MPVYNEETFFYEVLLRFGEIAPNKGRLTGAHRQTITQTTKDEVVIATQINPPEQLALVSGEDGQLLSAVLGEVNAATLVLNGQLQTSLAQVNAIAAQQLDDLTKVRADLAVAQTGFADSQQALADQQAAAESAQAGLHAQIDDLTAAHEQVVEDLQSQIEDLHAQLASAAPLQAEPDDTKEDAVQA